MYISFQLISFNHYNRQLQATYPDIQNLHPLIQMISSKGRLCIDQTQSSFFEKEVVEMKKKFYFQSVENESNEAKEKG